MIGYCAPLSTPRPSAHRPGLAAMARTAGIAGGVLALARCGGAVLGCRDRAVGGRCGCASRGRRASAVRSLHGLGRAAHPQSPDQGREPGGGVLHLAHFLHRRGRAHPGRGQALGPRWPRNMEGNADG